MGSLLKKILVVLFLLVLFLPVIQKQFKFLPEDLPLYGAYNNARDTSLNLGTWLTGIYQERAQGYLNENFGFRNFLVRFNSQIDFSVYGSHKLLDVFKGKNDYMFNSSFFNSYSGRSYKGNKYADSIFNTVKKLNDWLVARNKKLLVCFAPCKESFYTEYLPDSCLPFIKQENYYNFYRKKLRENNIPLLDYNTYFLSLKKKSPYPLFTQGAVHWTNYGTYLALDTLVKRISGEINKKMYLINITSVELSDTPRFTDDDIYETMNLLKKLNSEKLAYPTIKINNAADSCYKPKVLIVGDSYYSCLNDTWLPLHIFSKESYFMYYYILAKPYDGNKKDEYIKDMNVYKELEGTDIVILFYNIGRLDEFPNGSPSIINEQ